jgi:uncharacterized phage protein gp47/JayE
MNITIPTVTELRDQILADIETKTGQTAPLMPRAVWRVLALALAGPLHLLYRLGLWLYAQIFTSTMDDAALELRGLELGITRGAATRFVGTAAVTGTGRTIAVGTIWQKDGVVYEVTEALSFTTSGTVKIQSLEYGDRVSLDVSDVINLVSTLEGLDSTATISAVTQAGEDQETLDAYRARIQFAEQNKTQGAAKADYIARALEVTGIAEAFAHRPAAGFVNVYPLTDDADPANRIPGSSKLAEVEAYINDEHWVPFSGATVSAVAFADVEFDVDISDLSPNTVAVKTAVETAITAYMYARRLKQYEDDPNPKDIISQVELAKIVYDAGAKVATVDLKNSGGSSITSYELTAGELAVLGEVSWL